METNNIDKVVKDLLKSRTITPSDSAWERLAVQLDENSKKKKRAWIFYVGYAASFLLLISSFYFINTKYSSKKIHKQIAQQTKKDSTKVTIKTEKKTAVVKETVLKKESKKIEKTTVKIHQKATKVKEPIVTLVASNEDSITTKKTPVVKKELISRISINSNDLLASVEKENNRIEQYYSDYNVDREELLASIQEELAKENLTIDANTLLAEVEKNVEEESFKKSFMQLIKGEFKSLATSLANRNN